MNIALQNPKEERLFLLDGLRGIAAISVMVFHYTQHNGLDWLEGAWAAVDLFFVLSGFVIAKSYQIKIIDGMGFKRFMTARLIRLLPLYLFGTALGLAALLIYIQTHSEGPVGTAQLAKAAALAPLLIPYLNWNAWPLGDTVIWHEVFPLNPPAWSLFFELFINAVFFLIISRTRRGLGVLAIGVLFVFYFTTISMLHQFNPGWGTGNFLPGFPRVTLEFFLGVLIHSKREHFAKVPPTFSMFLTLVALGLFMGNQNLALFNALVLLPLTVALLSNAQVGPASARVCTVLGDLSYPIYVIHFPIQELLFRTTQINTLSPSTQTIVVSSIVMAISFLLIPADVKVRRALTTALARKRHRPRFASNTNNSEI